MTTINTLTLAGMLDDPLIRLMMRSDNVSAEDHSRLLHRVRVMLVSRAAVTKADEPEIFATPEPQPPSCLGVFPACG